MPDYIVNAIHSVSFAKGYVSMANAMYPEDGLIKACLDEILSAIATLRDGNPSKDTAHDLIDSASENRRIAGLRAEELKG